MLQILKRVKAPILLAVPAVGYCGRRNWKPRRGPLWKPRAIKGSLFLSLIYIYIYSLSWQALPTVHACRASSLLMSAFPVHSTSFSHKSLQWKNKDCKISRTVKRLWAVELVIVVFRPYSITETFDWALETNDLTFALTSRLTGRSKTSSIYPSITWETGLKSGTFKIKHPFQIL